MHECVWVCICVFILCVLACCMLCPDFMTELDKGVSRSVQREKERRSVQRKQVRRSVQRKKRASIVVKA